MLPTEGHDLSCCVCAVADIECRFYVSQSSFEGGVFWINIKAIRSGP
jgi:hypothetical protein